MRNQPGSRQQYRRHRIRTLIAYLVAVLALEVVHIAAIDQIDGVDKKLRPPHRSNEVAWPGHLRHKLHEQLCAAIGKDAREQAVQRADKAAGIGKAVVVLDGRVVAVGVWCYAVRIDKGARRS